MAKVEVILPQMGEGIIEATITRWLADINSTVEEDEPIIEIATDKVDSEIPAPVSGVLVKQFFSEGETPKIGEVIAIIDNGSDDDSNDDMSIVKNQDNASKDSLEAETPVRKERPRPKPHVIDAKEIKGLSPFIRQFARARGINFKELQQIKGSGTSGQITKSDIYNYIKGGRPFRIVQYPAQQKEIEQEYIPKEGEEIIELDRTRILIGQHMVRSVQEAPHVTSFVEADVTALVEWRDAIKNDFKSSYGVNLTYTPIIVEAVVKALKEFPYINASLLSNNQLVLKKYINIGIATALPDNNLIVPVIKNADRLNLSKLAIDISDKSARARKGELQPSEITGGTFTITNLGQFKNISGTPIINQPESAILAVGAIKKKPGVVRTQDGFSIGIRDIIMLSLSYDHRTVDGALGGAFLNRIGQLLEDFNPSDLL